VASSALAAWEAGADMEGPLRALALARMVTRTDAASLPLGRRDAHLLELYSDVHGQTLEAQVDCPSCEATLSLDTPIGELRAGYEEDGDRGGLREFTLGEVRVQARCPTTADLLAVESEPTVPAARAALLARCVASVSRNGGAAGPLDDAEIEELGHRLELVDPLVDVRFDVTCDECGHRFAVFLDVPELVWEATRRAARRTLRNVHVLAQRYGWTEGEILRLSERRLKEYLDLA
jgi:hypothetical protein